MAPGSSAVAGIFGKLPAHGDFVRRGWPDETIDAVDRWLTAGVAALRDSRDEDAFADAMRAAPMWHGHVPAGQLGPLALHLAVAPSTDRAGRLFPIAAGWAGRGRAGSATVLDESIYDAVAGRLDADALVAALDGAAADGEGHAPAVSAWWPGVPGGEPAVESDTVDAALLHRLLSGEPA
jgi:type VI secretion system protein ImpM